ncbi:MULTISPECIES: hypothetical protein [unclassified Acinetobacter]|uniref:hypothetical protein n=1 Tax=unclassified Acinetobacter TaxID=196816 RepID=UPI0015D457AB|nr:MULTISPECIES: hypothetical protein [unclassified Acinetobacter]
MAQLTVEQMVQLAKESKSQPSNPKKISINEMVELAKSSKQHKNLGSMPAITVDVGEPSSVKSFILGAVNDVGGGINQLVSGAKDFGSSAVNKLLGTDLKTDRYKEVTRETKAVDDAYEKARARTGQTGSDGWRTSGAIVGSLPFGAGGIGKNVATTVAKSGGLGALIGGAQFAENADKRVSNMQSGALGGALGGVAAKKIGDGITRVVNAKKGNYKEGVKEVWDQAEKHGIRTSVGDLGRNPIAKKAEVQLEEIPLIGTSNFRKGQHDEAKAAAEKVVENLRGKMSDVDYKSLDKIQAAAASGDKNAMRIMKIVNEAGDDSGKVLQAAAEIKNWRGQRVASQMYDRVQNLAGDGAIAPNKTVLAIDDIIANDSKVIPNAELQKELLAIRNTLGDMNIKKDFREMRAVQSRLGELVSEWGSAGKKGSSAFTKIRTAIDDDILDFAQNSGNTKLFGELKRANSLYGQLQQGKDKAFANAARSIEPDQIFNQFIKAGKGDKAANFYKNLDPKGQAALRYQMAQNALDKSLNESTGAFSPAKFALEFERMSAPYSNVFSGGDKAQMDGFIKLMRHIERAGQYMENPPTGNRAVPWLLGGGAAVTAMSSIPLALTGVGATALTKTLLTTNAGKRILLAAKDLPPDSPKLANLIKQAQKLATTSGAIAATE